MREVRDKNNDSLMYFPCGMWFDSTVGDKRVVRSIAAVRQLPFKETSGMLIQTMYDENIFQRK